MARPEGISDKADNEKGKLGWEWKRDLLLGTITTQLKV